MSELAVEVLASQPASRQWPWAGALNICTNTPLYFLKGGHFRGVHLLSGANELKFLSPFTAEHL